jgi:hypothetical protein
MTEKLADWLGQPESEWMAEMYERAERAAAAMPSTFLSVYQYPLKPHSQDGQADLSEKANCSAHL